MASGIDRKMPPTIQQTQAVAQSPPPTCTQTRCFNETAMAIGFFIIGLICAIGALHFYEKSLAATVAFGVSGGLSLIYAFYLASRQNVAHEPPPAPPAVIPRQPAVLRAEREESPKPLLESASRTIEIHEAPRFKQDGSLHQVIDVAAALPGEEGHLLIQEHLKTMSFEQINQLNENFQTPLHYAFSIKAPYAVMDALLKDERVQVRDMADFSGQYAIYHAVNYCIEAAKSTARVEPKILSLVQRLLEKDRRVTKEAKELLAPHYDANPNKFQDLGYEIGLEKAIEARFSPRT